MKNWFRDAKFGMFMHWGVYSVLGEGEWVMHKKPMTVKEYEKLPPQFNPTEYDPAEWVRLAKRAGIKYITFTSKHHDGFAMWNSKVTDWDIVDRTPYRRDVIKMLADECKKQGIQFFLYYSHLDWHHPDYYPRGRTGQYTGRPDKGNFKRYLDYMNAQLTELCSGEYGEIGGIWFDGWWDQQIKGAPEGPQKTQVDWRLQDTYELIHTLQPQALIGNNHHVATFPGEDFQIFEKDLPGRNTAGWNADAEIGALPLETCETINKSWGYNKNDKDFKSVRESIHYLVRAAGYDSNFLLNVGPMPNGRIQSEFVERLEEMGKWMERYGESIYGTRGGPFDPTEQYVTTHRDNKIYVHVLDWKGKNNIMLPSVTDRLVKRAWVLGSKTSGETSTELVRQHPWGLLLVVPEAARLDTVETIVVLEVEGEANDLFKPRLVEPGPSDVVLLRGEDAKLVGKLVHSQGPDWIEGWTNVGDAIIWRVKLAQEGHYELALTYACSAGAGGSEFEILAGGSKTTGIINETKGWYGGWQNFEKKTLDGKLRLPAGVSTVTLRIRKKTGTGEIARLHALELIPSAAKDKLATTKERAKKRRAKTDWFVAARYGVMFHWTPQTQPRSGPQNPFPDAVRDFDVDAFARMVSETGAGYVIFTSAHGIQWLPAPIKTIEKILAGRTCDRDLIADMADALDRRGVKLILYYHHGVGDHEWSRASGFLSQDKSRFFQNEYELLTEIGERYGKKVVGYWFDDRYPLQPFERLYEATKAGNPDRIVAWNSWILPKTTEFQEYYAGELGGALYPLPEQSYFRQGGPQEGLQPHVLIFIDDPWIHGYPDTEINPPMFSDQQLIDYVKDCNSKGAPVTINLGIYQDGRGSQASLDLMRKLRKAIRGD